MALAAFAAVGCGSDDGEDEAAKPQLLDPSQPQHGKTYAEWAAEWVRYYNRTSPPECSDPVLDSTGEDCALNQDPASPVFFLAGTFGGPALRDACVAPAGAALFFPLINVWGDNAGVPLDMRLTDEQIRSYVEGNFAMVDLSSLFLEVDGRAVEHLERGAIQSAPYTVEHPAGDNIYTCSGIEEEGSFDGYVSGYWAMLAPLSPGQHQLRFGGVASGTQPGIVNIDVQYELLIQ